MTLQQQAWELVEILSRYVPGETAWSELERLDDLRERARRLLDAREREGT